MKGFILEDYARSQSLAVLTKRRPGHHFSDQDQSSRVSCGNPSLDIPTDICRGIAYRLCGLSDSSRRLVFALGRFDPDAGGFVFLWRV